MIITNLLVWHIKGIFMIFVKITNITSWSIDQTNCQHIESTRILDYKLHYLRYLNISQITTNIIGNSMILSDI